MEKIKNSDYIVKRKTVKFEDSNTSSDGYSNRNFRGEVTLVEDYDFGLEILGARLEIITITQEVRFLYAIHTPIQINYANSYVKSKLLPLVNLERVSFDSYISGRELYVNSAYKAFVGVNISNNHFGIVPRTISVGLALKDGHVIKRGE